jgi:exonuclease III
MGWIDGWVISLAHCLQEIDHPGKQINKDASLLNCTVYQMDLIDIYRVFHSTAVEYTFFSISHGTFSKTDNGMGLKANS